MKMVKTLLLGSAAGLVAIAGAQAADLPVKAKPVQYVKICSLYGVGFYYIPGTDICLKIGGWVRAETAYGTNGSSTAAVSSADRNNRFTDMWWWRARGYITADARNQTEYGTVRSYLAIGLSGDNAVAFSSNRAFIQWAGFTFGLAQSFYDFFSSAAVGYNGWWPSEDTGDGGQWVMAYTAQFGNGFSASLSAEAANTLRTTIINQDSTALAVAATAGSTVGGAAGPGAYGGLMAPDIVGNIRVDQVWGSAQIMGAGHLVNSQYYSAAAPAPPFENSGHPDDKWGWIVGAGLKINTPFISQGDYFQAEVNYTEGNLRRLAIAQGGGNYYIQHGTGVAYGVLSDGVYGGAIANNTATDVELTTGWSVNASYEHFWNPRWRTSIYGAYMAVSYNDRANAMLCRIQGFAAPAAAAVGSAAVATPGCDNNWNFWAIGSRTQWNVTKDFYMGVDVLYGQLEGATTPTGLIGANTAPANTACGTGLCRTDKEDILAVRFRVHRDFYP